MRSYRDEPGTGHVMRQREILRRMVARGDLVRAEVCEKCEQPPERPPITWAHLPNIDDFSSIVWLCAPCYRAVNPRGSPRTYKRGDTHRIAPAYEVMKYDWCVRGLTLTQMAAEYGYANPEQARTAVWNTLRDRAQRRGEWPLSASRKVDATGIWLAIQHYLYDYVDHKHVKIPRWIAERQAPRSVLQGGIRSLPYLGTERAHWKMVFPEVAAHYHVGACKNALNRAYTGKETLMKLRRRARRAGVDYTGIDNVEGKAELVRRLNLATPPFFVMTRQEAEDWGYYQCQECAGGLAVIDFARMNGINEHFMWGLSSGRTRMITKERARQLLTAIGEPIPKEWRAGPDVKGPRRVADSSRHAP